ncbi:hypothetical protein [Chryseobacterium indoltheticum]|uniref:hypothetical protein n=1 Tax=Chryseobacterium indoltheticum TaxID=254 RepID=UPI003F498AF5
MSRYINRLKLLSLLLMFFVCSCSQEEESLFAEDVPGITDNNSEYGESVNYLTDIGTININVLANGNYPGVNDASFIKDINTPNFAYCHPDVEYFPNGFNGYKYWMVFTPFLGH